MINKDDKMAITTGLSPAKIRGNINQNTTKKVTPIANSDHAPRLPATAINNPTKITANHTNALLLTKSAI